MAAGLHSVLVYPDRSAGDWSDPVASNPYFTAGLQGWTAGPFAAPLAWSSDGRCIGLPFRDRNYPCLTPMAARTYRLRATVTIDRPGTVFANVYFGLTPTDAEIGPYWSPDGAQLIWAGWNLPAGTHQVSQTWTAPPWQAGYPYIGPAINSAQDASGAGVPITVDSLVLDYLTSGGEDLSCLVDSVAITHGRDDSTGQPEPASATLDFTVTPEDPLPAVVEVGAVVVVTTTVAQGTSQRFVGRISDLALGWNEAGPDTPDAGTGQLVCTSLLADLGRRVVGDTPWPQQLDGARVAAIMAAAGIDLDPAWSDPGTVQILARDVDSQPALELARGVASDAGGILWHTRDGDIRYADADHRRGVAPAMELDACDVLVTPTWRRTTEGLINRVSLGYGPEPEDGGEQPRYLAESLSSIGRFGEYAYTAATQLANAADAAASAQLLMVRNVSPVWIMAALPVDTRDLSAEDYAALLGLDVHSLLTLTGMPAIGAAPTSAVLWVEGWTETLAWGVHDIELVVSGYCRTSPPPRWDDLNPAWTWDAMGSLTWDAATCMGPPTDQGRWNDTPASLRWSQVPPATTWNTWGQAAAALTTADERELVSHGRH